MKFAHLKGHNSFSWIAVLRRGKVDAYIQLHNVFVELYLHKRCNCAYLLKFLKLFKTLIAGVCLFVCFNSRPSHLRWHEYHRMFGIDLLRNTIACPFLEWQLLFDVIFIVIYL